MSFHLMIQAAGAQLEPISKLVNLVKNFFGGLLRDRIPADIAQDQRGMTFHLMAPFLNVRRRAYSQLRPAPLWEATEVA
jgi:hypothetical protein